MRVQIVVFAGVDEMDLIAPFEVLASIATRAGDGSTVTLVSPEAPRMLVTALGVPISVTERIAPVGDLLIVPGGGWSSDRPDSVRAECERGALPEAVRVAAAGHRVVASVCTGAMLLSAAGLLTGRRATTHHSAVGVLQDRGTVVVPGRVVDDGDIVTASGVTSGLDLGLHLGERFWGAAAAIDEERRLEYERRGTVWKASAVDPPTPGETKPVA